MGHSVSGRMGILRARAFQPDPSWRSSCRQGMTNSRRDCAGPGIACSESTRMTDSTRKLDRRGLRAAEQLETELPIAEVDDLADQGRGIGLRECQDPIKIVSLAGDRIGL